MRDSYCKNCNQFYICCNNRVLKAFNDLGKELSKIFQPILKQVTKSLTEVLMIYTEHKKQEYWDHFLKLPKYWPHGFTEKRLQKVKPIAWEDQDFWDDILLRHGGYECSPEFLKEKDLETYQHCFGNFAGMLSNIMLKNKIIRS